jgi:hypothetical protein
MRAAPGEIRDSGAGRHAAPTAVTIAPAAAIAAITRLAAAQPSGHPGPGNRRRGLGGAGNRSDGSKAALTAFLLALTLTEVQ